MSTEKIFIAIAVFEVVVIAGLLLTFRHEDEIRKKKRIRDRSQQDTDDKIIETLADAERRDRSQQDTDDKIIETLADAERSSPSNRLANTERELEETKRELEETKGELEEKTNRLSAIISSRIRDNNPNIVNLGDQFRANKLGEMSSELYDNEWTDAFEELARKGYAETESIRIFLDIIMITYQLCHKSTEDEWAIVKDWIPDDGESATIRLALREGKKAKAVMAMENHQSKIAQVLTAGCRDDKLRPLVSGPGPVYVYVNACVKLWLLMVLHDPPVVWKCPQWSSDMFLAQPLCADVSDARVGMPEQIAMSMKRKDTAGDLGGSKTIQFDTSFFKPYTAAGNYIKHIVWPAMLIHENGPILRKGIAQGFYKEVSSESTCVNILT